jgi:hypothetical protein
MGREVQGLGWKGVRWMQSGWRKRKRGTKKVPTKFPGKLDAAVEEELRFFQENGVNVLNADGTTKRPLSVYEQAFVIAAGRIKRSLRL